MIIYLYDFATSHRCLIPYTRQRSIWEEGIKTLGSGRMKLLFSLMFVIVLLRLPSYVFHTLYSRVISLLHSPFASCYLHLFPKQLLLTILLLKNIFSHFLVYFNHKVHHESKFVP